MLGLLQALRSFDPDRGVSFLTFVRFRIRGAIYDELRRSHPIGHTAFRRGVTVEHRGELDAIDERPIDAGLLERERRAHLHEAVDALPPRLQFVVTSYYFEDRQVKDLAPELGVTASRVSKMHAQALSQLRNSLEDR